MSYVVALYKGKRTKIECYWYRDGYVELIQAIRSKFSIKHEIELKLYHEKRDTYVLLNKPQMSEIPKKSSLKVIDPNNQSKVTTKQQSKKPISAEEVNKMRKCWKIGSRCEIYSGSQEKWIEGQITNILTDLDGEWLQVQCVSIETKEMPRFSEYIRPIISASDKESWNKPKKHKMYVIGNGNSGELSLGYLQYTKELIPSQHQKHIESIACGNKYSIYCDYYNQNFWVSGCNENGECAIGKESISITTFTLLKYFAKRKIKIKKVFANVAGSCTYWLTRCNRVYGNGSNRYSQLGLMKDWKNKYEPVLIKGLFNVVDIKSAEFFCVALCDHGYIVINYWLQKNQHKDNQIPVDIIILFKRFYGMKGDVYSTKHNFGANKGKWNKMNVFSNKEIIKIEVGLQNGVFLTVNGELWGFDDTGMYSKDIVPRQIFFHFLVKQKIKIKDIKCGAMHTLAIDNENKIYSWGKNSYKQCGYDAIAISLRTPKKIASLKDEQIKSFKCGFYHSLACTMDNKYFMWGKNKYNECIVARKEDTDEKSKETVSKPLIINNLLEKECNGKEIKEIYLGYDNTKLLVIDS